MVSGCSIGPRARMIGLVALVALLGACAGSEPEADKSAERPTVWAGVPKGKVFRPDALIFVEMDDDEDATVTSAEAQLACVRVYRRADVDQSGSISQIEFADWQTRQFGGSDAGFFFQVLDTNQNGGIAPEEFCAMMLKRFKIYDQNSDGLLTRTEMAVDVPRPEMPRERPASMPPGGMPGGGMPGGGGGMPGGRPPGG